MHLLFDMFSAWFFVSLAILLILEIVSAENDACGTGFVILALWLGLALAFTDFNPFPWIRDHYILTILLAVAYVVVGVVYTYFRWWMLLRTPSEWKYATSNNDEFVQDPARYKDRLITWMMWWPPSLLWWLLRWPRKLFTAIYNVLSTSFMSMARSAPRQKTP